MRAVLTLTLLSVIAFAAWQLTGSAAHNVGANSLTTSTAPTRKVDFNTEIKPIFQARCQPCHFQGGKVYDQMPFDKPETITKLGAKLFTRIKDEKEQRLIREFLDQP
jgi:hypothetical protein